MQQNHVKMKSNPSKLGAAGTIKKLDLTNFMNHARLELDFCSRVNIIHGKNGAGKSVIGAALAVVFGSSASDTGRGKKMGDLIQHGKNKAVVKIVMCNEGIGAFDPEKWGNEILITRTIHEKHSQYEVTGSAVDAPVTKKETTQLLRKIVDHFNIQISNPVIMMTQDVSKQFLQNQNDSNLYNIFIEATKLRHMYDLLDQTESVIKVWDHRINLAELELPVLKENLKKAEEDYKSVTVIENLEEDLMRLQVERVWTLIKENEIEVETEEKRVLGLIKDLENIKKKQLRIDEAIKDCEIEYQKLSGENQAEMESKSEFESKAALLEQQIRNASKEVGDAYRSLSKKQSEIASIKRQIVLKRKEKEEQKRELDERKDISGELKAFQSKRVAIFDKIVDIRARVDCFEDKSEELERIKGELRSCKDVINDRNREIHQLNRNIENLRASQKNRVNIFGTKTLEVDYDIQQTHWPGDIKPIGPLGRFIVLRDGDYVSEVEFTLRHVLETYLCDSFASQAILKKILHKHYGANYPQIIVQKVALERYRPNCRYESPTVLEMIEISNDWAFNAIVDITSCERVVMIKDPTMRQGHDFLRAKENSDVKEIVTRTLETFKMINGSLANHRDAGQGGPKTHKLVVSNEEQIAEEVRHDEKKIELLKRDIAQFEEEQRKSDNIIASLNDEIRQMNKFNIELKKLESDLRKVDHQITDLEKNQPEAPNWSEYDVIVKDLEESMSIEEQKIEPLTEALAAARSHESCLKDQLLKGSFDSTKIDENNVKMDALIADQANFQKELKRSSADLARKTNDKETAEHTIVVLRSRLDDQVQKAQNLPKCEAKRPLKKIEAEIKNIESQLAKEREKIHVDIDVLLQAKEDAKMRYFRLENNLKRAKDRLQSTIEAKEIRDASWQKFRRSTANMVQTKFAMNLEKRGHSGQLKFDLDNDKIEISAAMNAVQSETGTDTNLKMLSGGERSFTTLSFVLALGDSLETPFRLLDEFDVFMDSVNRRIALDMLLKNAKEKNSQYLLLTPQDVSSVVPIKGLVKLLILPDPIRNNGVLPFERTS